MSLATSLFTAPLQTTLGAISAKPRATAADTPATGAGTASGTSSSATSSAENIGSTFLSLLVQELQNQDPTAPMDSTAMVGQMISLNQLNQLSSINQTLTNAYGASSSSSSSTGAQASSPNAQAATQAALQILNASARSAHPAVAPSVTLPAF